MKCSMAANSHKQQGFVLAATLWALAIMFIAVGILNTYVQRKMSLGLQAKENIQQSLDQISTEQTILYLLGTCRMTRAGLTLSYQNEQQFLNEEGFLRTDPVGDEVWLDGSVYQGLGDSLFSIQDAAGLITVNAADPSSFEQLLTQYEPNLAVRTRLIGALIDYVDADDLLSIGGAEKQDYIAKGMIAPTNDYLRSPVELQNVYGWKEWLQAHPQFRYQEWLGSNRMGMLNINTMPKPLLVNLVGLQESMADQYILERRTNPVSSIPEFLLRFNLSEQQIQDEKYRTFPTSEFRLSFWNKGGGQARTISLQLTPNGLLGPWLVDYEYSVQSVNNNNEPLALRQTKLFGHAMDVDR